MQHIAGASRMRIEIRFRKNFFTFNGGTDDFNIDNATGAALNGCT